MNETCAKIEGVFPKQATTAIEGSFPEPYSVGRPAPSCQATQLLSQVLGRLGGFDVPVVQVVECSPSTIPSSLAEELSMACLYWLGRTLVVNMCSVTIRELGVEGELASELVQSSLSGLSESACTGLLRDRSWPELFKINCRTGKDDQRDNQPHGLWLDELRPEFRIVLLNCGNLSLNPTAVGLTPRCHGSVLAVFASRTTHREIQDTARHIRSCGGRVLGAALLHHSCQSMPERKRAGITHIGGRR